MCGVIDTSNVSTGDLENIEETDTPPERSPDMSEHANDTQLTDVIETDTIALSEANSTARYSRGLNQLQSASLSDDADEEAPLLSLVEKAPPASSEKRPAELRPVVPPPHYDAVVGADSGADSSSSGGGGNSYIKKAARLVGSFSPPLVGSPADERVTFARDNQPRRIAEYNRNSWILMSGDSQEEAAAAGGETRADQRAAIEGRSSDGRVQSQGQLQQLTSQMMKVIKVDNLKRFDF